MQASPLRRSSLTFCCATGFVFKSAIPIVEICAFWAVNAPLFILPQRQRAHLQIEIHLCVVSLKKAVPLDAVLPEFGVTHFYAPRGQVGERKAPITVGRSAANYGRKHISFDHRRTLYRDIHDTL